MDIERLKTISERITELNRLNVEIESLGKMAEKAVQVGNLSIMLSLTIVDNDKKAKYMDDYGCEMPEQRHGGPQHMIVFDPRDSNRPDFFDNASTGLCENELLEVIAIVIKNKNDRKDLIVHELKTLNVI